jgi:ABC-2 type transport system permease protein
MFKTIFLKEIREGIYTYKFVLILLSSIALVPLSLYSGASTYKEQLRQYQHEVAESERTFKNQEPKPPHAAAHFGRVISKPPAPLIGLASGIHDALGVRSHIDPHQTPRLTGSQDDTTPMLSLFGHFDLAFLIETVFSLLALVYSFNLVSGEREGGTLRMIFSNSIWRSDVILGKVAAGLVMLFAPLTAAGLIGLLFLTPLFGVSLNAGTWLRILAILAASASYIALFFLLGIFVSTRTTRTMSSFILLVLAWAGLNFVIPRIAVMVSQTVYRIPSVQEIDLQIEAIRREELDKMVQRIQAYRNSNPESKDKPVPADVSVPLRRDMDEALEEREAKLMQSYEGEKWRQVRLAMALSRLSPCSAYANVVMEMAGTGVYRHDRFLRFLDEYRKNLRNYFDGLERQNVRTVNNFDNAPDFSFQEEPGLSAFGRIVVDIGLILAATLMLFAAAYFSFVRYDVR